MKFRASDIAAAVGGTLEGPDVEVDGATQDSRAIAPGQLFVPLVAERDGHDFIEAALAAGAVAYLTDREPVGGTAIRVADTAQALTSLGSVARDRLPTPVIGITGSVGKTSSKDLLAGVVGQRFVTHASRRSFNNEIGVPLTIFNAPDDTEATILEMGSRGIGHIATLVEVGRPSIALITTIAGAHTSEFGSEENIAVAKGELLDDLPPDGLAVLNADVPLCIGLRDRSPAPVLSFGRDGSADVRFTDVTLTGELDTRFTIESDWGRFEVEPATKGAHLVPNATAAATIGLHLGCSIEDVQAGLATAELSPWRMAVSRTASGALLINDAYNANPTSMRGALESLAAVDVDRRIAVLGYMAELGESEGEAHRAIVEAANALGIQVIAVGTDLYGEPPADDIRAAVGALDNRTAVLVKASRAAGLDAVASALAGD